MTIVEPSGGFAGKKGRESFDANFPSREFLDSLVEAGVDRLVLSVPLTDVDLTAYAFERYGRLVEWEAAR